MDNVKYLIDENISWRLKRLIKDWHILPANEIPTMNRITDQVIWRYAKNYNYNIITFDEDFVELYNLNGFPPKIIWLRMGNVTTQEIANKLIQLQDLLKQFNTDESSGVLEIY